MKQYFVLFAGLLTILSLSGKEIISYSNGELENKAATVFHAKKNSSEVQNTPNGFTFRDTSAGLQILNSEKLNFNKSGSCCITFRLNKMSSDLRDNPDGSTTDIFILKSRQMMFGRRGNRIYVNFHDGKKWYANMLSTHKNVIQQNKTHFAVVTYAAHYVPSSDEIWTDIKIYLDGALVLNRRVQGSIPAENNSPVYIGWGPNLGKVWNLDGTFKYIGIFDHELSQAEIKKMTLTQKDVIPAFQVKKKISKTTFEFIEDVRKNFLNHDITGLALYSAIKNFAFKYPDYTFSGSFQKKGKKKYVLGNLEFSVLPAKKTVLTIVTDPQKKIGNIVSLYDKVNKRELLRPDNSFFALNFKNSGPEIVRSNDMKCTLLQAPGIAGKFILSFQTPDSDTTVYMDAVFKNDRLEYTLSIKSSSLQEIKFPYFAFAPLSEKGESLLTPLMSGVVHDEPRKNNVVYNANYPSGRGAMQCGAYYDKYGGLYFACEDATVYPKTMFFQASEDGIEATYSHSPANKMVCNVRGKAVIEYFQGNWYDAGLIYRNFLHSAPWWIPELPRQDTPEWFRNNSVVFMTWSADIQRIKRLRKYLEMPFLLHWYSWHGLHDRDYPHFASSPEIYRKNKTLREMGIRTMAYTNARLFEEKDCRNIDRDFSRIGSRIAVLNSNGKIYRENYGTPFAVMCPAAPEWQDIMQKYTQRLLAHHFDGIYYDQIGASSPKICFSEQHGHKAGDMDHWYKYGYALSLEKIRSWSKKNYPDTIFTTEDNSEVYNRFMDGVLPWRWIHQGQVPFFTLCYSGQVQYIGLSYHFGGKIDQTSKYAKAANQLIWGQQIGWFTTGTAVKDTQFLLFIKKLAFSRTAFLDFFNNGILGRPLVFIKPPAIENLLWHRDLEDKYIKTPTILSAQWEYRKEKLYLFVNHTDKKQNICFEIPELNNRHITEFYSVINQTKNNRRKIENNTVSLQFMPREIIAVIVSDQKSNKHQKIQNIFHRIAMFKEMEIEK